MKICCPHNKEINVTFENGIQVFKHADNGKYCIYLNSYIKKTYDIQYEQVKQFLDNVDVDELEEFNKAVFKLLKFKDNNLLNSSFKYMIAEATDNVNCNDIYDKFRNRIKLPNKQKFIQIQFPLFSSVQAMDYYIKYMLLQFNEDVKLCQELFMFLLIHLNCKERELKSTICGSGSLLGNATSNIQAIINKAKAKAKDEDDIYNIKHNAYNIDIAYIIMVMLTHYISSAKLNILLKSMVLYLAKEKNVYFDETLKPFVLFFSDDYRYYMTNRYQKNQIADSISKFIYKTTELDELISNNDFMQFKNAVNSQYDAITAAYEKCIKEYTSAMNNKADIIYNTILSEVENKKCKQLVEAVNNKAIDANTTVNLITAKSSKNPNDVLKNALKQATTVFNAANIQAQVGIAIDSIRKNFK